MFTFQASSMRIPCRRGLWHRCPADIRSPRKSHRCRWTEQGRKSITGYQLMSSNVAGQSPKRCSLEGFEGMVVCFCATKFGFLMSSTRRVTSCHLHYLRWQMLIPGTLQPFKHFYWSCKGARWSSRSRRQNVCQKIMVHHFHHFPIHLPLKIPISRARWSQ